MKDAGRKITLTEAIQLSQEMSQNCGEGKPKKVDVAGIDWPFPFAKIYRQGRCLLAVTVCPEIGTGLTGIVDFIYRKFPERGKEIDAMISDWDQTMPFLLHARKYFDV